MVRYHLYKSASLCNSFPQKKITTTCLFCRLPNQVLDHSGLLGGGIIHLDEGGGYLGIGYDSQKGNPKGTSKSQLDPGYRAPVIAGDMRKLVPDQGYGMPKISCQHATSAQTMTSMEDYSKSLQEDVAQETSASVSASYMGASGSASFSYSNSVTLTLTFKTLNPHLNP